MSILTIETGADNPLLRQKSKPVPEISPSFQRLISDMKETLNHHQGLGLAAPQVGKLWRIILVKEDPAEEALVLINPQIEKKSPQEEIMEEGCLSLPYLFLPIKRSVKITVKALNEKGQPFQIEAQGLLARTIQHEIDHLEGILIVDRIK